MGRGAFFSCSFHFEMYNSQHPLVLTELLREVMNLPSPPPVSPSTPPPELCGRLDRLDRLAREAYPVSSTSSLGSPVPARMTGQGPWAAPTGGNNIIVKKNNLTEQNHRGNITTNVVLGDRTSPANVGRVDGPGLGTPYGGLAPLSPLGNHLDQEEGLAPATQPCGMPQCRRLRGEDK